MQFFRKYQKIIFIIVTVIIVISFTFFGTYSAFTSSQQKTPDRVIGKAIDGSKISKHEVDAFARFLATGKEPDPFSQHPRVTSLLNDGVMMRDILKSGLAAVLAEKYFDKIKPDLQARLEKVRKYRPYAHPEAPFLTAQSVWQKFVPAVNDNLARLKEDKNLTDEQAFEILCNLYASQAQFPPEMLKRMLSYQQHQYGVQPDPELTHGDLSLFGFQTAEDWFGPHFIELTAQYLINASAAAEQRGVAVSRDEARKALMRHIAAAIQNVEGADVRGAYQMSLQAIGLEDAHAVEIWRKVLSVRALFETLDQALVSDSLISGQFKSFANQSAQVELYQLPDELRLRSFRDLLKLQVYLDEVSPASYKSRGYCFQLPKQFLTLEEMEKTSPELVLRRFECEVAEVSKDSLTQNISLKETWDWELAEANWPRLKSEFSVLGQGKSGTREERFAILEKVEDQLRLKIDQFARDQIAAAHPEWITNALAQAESHPRSLAIRMGGDSELFQGLKDPAHLIALLDSSAPELANITFDGKQYYKIQVLSSSKQSEIMTFAEANREGILDTLLDQKLEEAYADAKKKDPKTYQNSDGSWKPLQEVRDKLGASLYASLFKALDEQIKKLTKEEKPTYEQYAAYRLYGHMKEAKEHLAANPEDLKWVRSAEIADSSPIAQWKLVKVSKELKRNERSAGLGDELFSMQENGWSSIDAPASGGLSFFRLLKRSEAAQKAVPEKQELAKLSKDAQKQLMGAIMKEIQDKQAIHVE